ncbi:MAG: TonB family protein [Cyclobacteriaceae bacterium]
MRNRKHDIEKYLRGELSPAEMHALEKEALNDPFLAEALEGVEQAGADNFLYDLHRLNRSVHDRSHRNRKTKTIKMWGWTAGIAATVLLIAVSGFLVVSLLKDQRALQLSMQEQAPAEETKPTQDSLTADHNGEPLALKDETNDITATEETSAKNDAPVPQKPQTSGGQVRAKESTDQTPKKKDDFDNERFLALKEKVKDDETPETAKQPEPRVIADSQETESKERESVPAATDKAGAVNENAKDAADEEFAKKIQGRTPGLDSRSRAPATTRTVPANPVLVKGKVVSAEDGDVLPGVTVSIKGTNTATVTDGEGNYELTIPIDNATLLFSFIGFTSKELQVTHEAEVNVEMAEDVSTLSEVIVTGYGVAGTASTEPAAFHSAEPERGKSDFKDYLEGEVKYPDEAIKNKAEGRVTIQFTVEPNGQLSEFQVLKGIGYGCDQELIRAIRQGPAWKPRKQGDQPVREKVKVRYRFELPK